MSKPNVTPGPWNWNGDGIKTSLWLLDEHNDAVLSGDIKVWNEADKPLIATAPTLLSAAKAIEEWWLLEGKHAFAGAPAAMFLLRDAIEKAQDGGSC